MPSAASSTPKCDPLVFAENMDSISKVNTIITKRMANLEKRKDKLEHYKEELARGKDLNEDQRTAVKALDSVHGSINLCQYLIGQIGILIQEDAKLEKVKTKKLHEKRMEQEFQRVSSVLKVQDVLARLGHDEIRQDFLEGAKGAVKIEESRLEQLDEVYKLVTPPTAEDRDLSKIGFQNQLKKATENMISLIDGKSKPIVDGSACTYRDLKLTINQISKCSYPRLPKSKETSKATSPVPQPEDRIEPSPEHIEEKCDERLLNGSGDPDTSATTTTTSQDDDNKSIKSNTSQKKSKSKEPPMSSPIDGPPGIPSMTIESSSNPPVLHPDEQNRISEEEQENQNMLTPQNSQLFYNQSHIQQQQLEQQKLLLEQQQQQQASRAINDLVACGGFNFLQESQVGSEQQQTSVYMDPAVVSFGSIKPEGLVQMHHQQSQQLSQVQQIHQQQKYDIERANLIQSQSYQSSNSPTPQQPQPSYTQNVQSAVYQSRNTNVPSCPPIPLPSQGRDLIVASEPNVDRVSEPIVERISEPVVETVTTVTISTERTTSHTEPKIPESTSWADQTSASDEAGWNASPPHTTTNGGSVDGGWGDTGGGNNNYWEEDEGKNNYNQNMDYDRRGYGNRGRGGNNGNFSRGRGGNNGFRGGGRGGGRGGYGGNFGNGGPSGGSGNYRGNYRGGRGSDRDRTDRGGMGYGGRGGNMGGGRGMGNNRGGGFRGRGNYNQQNRGGGHYQNQQ